MNTTGYIKRFSIMLVFLFPSYAFASDIGFMRMSLIDGDVQIYTNDAEDWVHASINISVKVGGFENSRSRNR